MKQVHKVSLRRAINDAVQSFGMTTVSNIEHLLIEWSFEAMRKINSRFTWQRKECQLLVENHCTNVPGDFMGLLSLKFNNTFLESTLGDFRHFGTPPARNHSHGSILSAPVGQNWVSTSVSFWEGTGVKYELSDGKIWVESLASGYIDIAYLGLCLDEEGFPKINEGHVDAISHYLQYRLAQLEFNRKPSERGYAQRMGMAKERWQDLCGQAYGADEMPDRVEQRVIMGIWNNMLPMMNLRQL